MGRIGFETEKYLSSQTQAFQTRINQDVTSRNLIEFGGKPFDDQHAARVLPGYEADCKSEVLRTLMPTARMVMVINAQDVLFPLEGRYKQGRLRGDSQLFYRQEVLRLIARGRELGLRIDETIISISPVVMSNSVNQHVLDNLQNALAAIGMKSKRFYAIKEYPSIKKGSLGRYSEAFEKNGQLSSLEESVTVFSPGGGSGKFGVLLSEAYFFLKNNMMPSFIKFETFPVFDLEADHALNLAFAIATADLNNKVVALGKKSSSYDKDVQNFRLLKWLFSQMGYGEKVSHMQNPTHMGINKITDGVTDWNVIIDACRAEIAFRIARYTREVQEGIESPDTLVYANQIAQIFDQKYPLTTKTFLLGE